MHGLRQEISRCQPPLCPSACQLFEAFYAVCELHCVNSFDLLPEDARSFARFSCKRVLLHSGYNFHLLLAFHACALPRNSSVSRLAVGDSVSTGNLSFSFNNSSVLSHSFASAGESYAHDAYPGPYGSFKADWGAI